MKTLIYLSLAFLYPSVMVFSKSLNRSPSGAGKLNFQVQNFPVENSEDSATVDLVVKFLATSIIADAGTEEEVIVLEDNIGNSLASGHLVNLYLSADTLLDASDKLYEMGYSYQSEPGYTEWIHFSVSIPDTLANGNYYFIAVLDEDFRVTETNENNNTSFIPVRVQRTSTDLVITDFSLNHLIITPGGTLTSTLKVRNNGPDMAETSYTGYYISADSIIDTDTMDIIEQSFSGTIDSGGSYLQSQYLPNINFPAGDYYLFAFADINKQVIEYDEGNNVSKVKFKIIPTGNDLVISTLNLPNLNVTVGSVIYPFTVEENLGNQKAESHHIGYYLSYDSIYNVANDTYLHSNYLARNEYYFNRLEPGVRIPSWIDPGVYYLIAIADYGDVVEEFQENNNTLAIKITIGNPIITGIGIMGSTEDIKIYPNPSSGIVNINNSAFSDEVEVTEISGNVLSSQKIIQGSNTLNFSGLKNGLYFLRIRKEGVVISDEKLIISK